MTHARSTNAGAFFIQDFGLFRLFASVRFHEEIEPLPLARHECIRQLQGDHTRLKYDRSFYIDAHKHDGGLIIFADVITDQELAVLQFDRCRPAE